jgi:hypothetical protein
MSEEIQKPSLVISDNPFLDNPNFGEEEASPSNEAEQPQETEGASAANAQEQAALENIARRAYEIDPEDIYGSIKKLYDEDPRVRNVLKSFLGRERQKELKDRIRQLEAELNQERLLRSQLMLRSVPEEQLPQLLEQDPNLKSAYEYVSNYSEADSSAPDIEDLIEEEFEQAEAWLPPGRIQNYIAAMGPGGCKCNAIPEPHGVFDHDEHGRELGPMKAFMRFRQVLGQEVEMAKKAFEMSRRSRADVQFAQQPVQPVATQVPQQLQQQQAQQQKQPAPTRTQVAQAMESIRNPALNANPDLSSGGLSIGSEPITKEQFDRMSVEEIIRRWPNPGDFERAVEAGQVLIPGLNS